MFFTKELGIESSIESEGDQNVACFIADDQFSNDPKVEQWVRRIVCFGWCYELCTCTLCLSLTKKFVLKDWFYVYSFMMKHI